MRRYARLRAEMAGDEAPEPYDVGQDVTIVSAPDATLVGQSGTIVSQHCGLYYAVDVGGAISYQPDGNLGGERPMGAEDTATAMPAAPPAAAPTPAPGAVARALAATGGSTIAKQLEVADLAALGRAVLRETKTTTADDALGAVRAALLDAGAAATLRAAETKRKTNAEAAERGQLLVDGIRKTGLPRSAFLNEDGSPAEGYRACDISLAALRAQVARLGAAAPLGRTIQAATSDEAGLADRARKSGMTVEERRRSEANVSKES